MGCKAITPHLVGLAKRLRNKPFHLVATHCQRDTKENVVAYVQGKGLEANAPNFTVTSFGGHPKVKGNGYVPYYMVFDHHGKLVHHHMCGDYHGGDGLQMIAWVDKLLADAPAIYLGDAPFSHCAKLAEQIGKKKDLDGALREIDKRTEATPGREELLELARLKEAVVDYRDRMLKRAESMLATNPEQVTDAVGELAKELKGSSIAEPVEARLAELRRSRELRDAISIHRRYEKILKKLDADAPARTRAKAADALEKLVEGHDGLPVAKTIRAKIEELRK